MTAFKKPLCGILAFILVFAIVFSIIPSFADLGYIKTRPVVAKNFDGVVPKHIYIVNDNTASSTVNERTSLYGKDGSYAGVVNSNNDAVGYG